MRSRYRRGKEDRLERRARVLVGVFHQGLVIVLEEFLSPKDRLFYRQVDDGMAEQCIWEL